MSMDLLNLDAAEYEQTFVSLAIARAATILIELVNNSSRTYKMMYAEKIRFFDCIQQTN